MFDILQYLPPKTRRSQLGWYSFNCPACVHNGETPDRRKRGGILLDENNWAFSCFNCGFKTKFVSGQPLSLKTRKLLSWIGVDDDTIQRINLESLKHKQIYDLAADRTSDQNDIIQRNIFFKKVELPSTARSILSSDTWAVEYLNSRGLSYRDYPFKISPTEKDRNANRIIIPYYYNKDVVGWTSRYLDSKHPKYINEHQQPGYVFGLEMQKPDWDFIIVSEGTFDAISINGVAILHNEISDVQQALLRRQGKEVIVVPDRDSAGVALVDQALAAGFSVSLPDWGCDIKDINDAVKEYGKIGTLLSIVRNRTTSRIKARVAVNNMLQLVGGNQ